MKQLLFPTFCLLAACTEYLPGEDVETVPQAVTASQYCYATTVTEITNCIADVEAHSIGGTVEIAPGLYYPTSTFEVNASNVLIKGAGVGSTYISYQGSSGTPLFEFSRDGSWSVARGQLRDMWIYSSYTGTIGVKLEDVIYFQMEDVEILGFDTGLLIQGRDTMEFNDIVIKSDKPIVMQKGPNYSGHADSITFNGLQVHETGTDDPIIEIDEECLVDDLEFIGMQLWVGGSYGLYWPEDASGSTKSGNIFMQGVRREQAASSGATFYINRTSSTKLDHFVCESCTLASASDGAVFDYVLYPSFRNSSFDGNTGKYFQTLTNYTTLWNQSNFVVER